MTIHMTNLAPVVPADGSRTDPRTVVSSLWLFAILNYLYCDLLGLMYPKDLQGFLNGNVGGLVIDQQFLLYAAILMTVPMAVGPHLPDRCAPVRAHREHRGRGGDDPGPAGHPRLRDPTHVALPVLLRRGGHEIAIVWAVS